MLAGVDGLDSMAFLPEAIERRAWLAASGRASTLSRQRRRERGIVATPPEIARAMAQRVDRLLRDRLGHPLGLADPRVSIVDPACGTGTFVAAAFAVAGARNGGPSVLAMDIDPDALHLADHCLRGALREAGWSLELNEANALEQDALPSISPNATVVVLGNPPWAARSANRNALAPDARLDAFRKDDRGQPLNERKIGVLSDDYVRFFRWSAEIARRPTPSILALVTNGSFLDGRVHRGMRSALARWFEVIEILDLGGNALLSRAAGDRDDNVFGVKPSAAITLAYRSAGAQEPCTATLLYQRFRGSREEKLRALAHASESRTLDIEASGSWIESSESARFPGDWLALDEVMPFHREGVQTNRDAAVIDDDPRRLLVRMRRFAAGQHDPLLAAALLARPHYDPELARDRVRRALELGQVPIEIAYRPFDRRFFFPITPICHRPRPALQRAIEASSLALYTVAKDRGSMPWMHVGAGPSIADNCFLSNRSSCRTRVFPSHGPSGESNLSERVGRELERRALSCGVLTPTEAWIRYALIVLSTRSYRERFDEALRRELPRLPLPDDRGHWEALVTLGEELQAVWNAPRGPFETRRIGHYTIERAPASMSGPIDEAEAIVEGLLRR